MLTRVATAAGEVGKVNEDYFIAADDMVVVLDGLTSRTETGCIHGVAWYVEHLANAILNRAQRGPREALAAAIQDIAERHRDTCDLTHPGTPTAAIAIVQATAAELR